MTAQAGEFRVVVSGDVVGGRDPREVAESFAKLVKVDAAKARRYLRGKPCVIKRRTDRATAMKYQFALTSIGVATSIESLTDGSGNDSTCAGSPATGAMPAPKSKPCEAVSNRAATGQRPRPAMRCPACHTGQPQSKKCAECGVYVEKARLIQEAANFKPSEAPVTVSMRSLWAKAVGPVAVAALLAGLAWTGTAIALN